MVGALEAIQYVEDRHLLAGHVLALVDNDYDSAEQMFLHAKVPQAALDMRKDLKHWAAALRLAAQFDPDSVAEIMSQHAASLELQGDAAAALKCFSDALAAAPRAAGAGAAKPASSSAQLIERCRAGVARCTIQSGDVRGGMRKALALGRHDVLLDCAAMLESAGTGGLDVEAGELYEAAGEKERACEIYIKARAFAKAEPLIKGVRSAPLLLAVRHKFAAPYHAKFDTNSGFFELAWSAQA